MSCIWPRYSTPRGGRARGDQQACAPARYRRPQAGRAGEQGRRLQRAWAEGGQGSEAARLDLFVHQQDPHRTQRPVESPSRRAGVEGKSVSCQAGDNGEPRLLPFTDGRCHREAGGKRVLRRRWRGRGPLYRGSGAEAWGEDPHQIQEHGDRGDRAKPPSRRRLRGPWARDSGDRPGGVDRTARRRDSLAHRRTDPAHEQGADYGDPLRCLR